MLWDNLEGWDEMEVGRSFMREGTYVYLWLTHVDVWEKPIQYYKAITLQLKTKKIKILKICVFIFLANISKYHCKVLLEKVIEKM